MAPHYPKAQEIILDNDASVNKIKVAFNKDSVEQIYQLLSKKYQSKISLQQFSTAFKKFHHQMGNWTTAILETRLANSASYVANFEHDSQLLIIKWDSTGLLEQFNFTPIQKPVGVKLTLVHTDNRWQTPLDSLIEKYCRPYIQQSNTVGLMVAVIDGKNTYAYSYGETEKNNKVLPTAQTFFEIGSITKTFTATLLAGQIRQGTMQLGDPINKYLPDSIPEIICQGQPVTLLTLANHSSGFPRLPSNIYANGENPLDPYKSYDDQALYGYLSTVTLGRKPGESFDYSNLGAGLLGELISRAANKTFEELIIQEICRPLKMFHTKINLNKSDSVNLAQGYNANGEATPLWNLGSLQGSGALRSTLADMTLYIRKQINPSVKTLGAAIRLTQQLSFSKDENKMGLGWKIKEVNNKRYYHHSGGTGGFRSFVAFDNEQQLGVVILSNAAEEVTPIGEQIMEAKRIYQARN